MPGVSVVGVSSSLCSFVSWGTPSPCVKSVGAWPPAKENFGIWVCPALRLAPPWLMPTNIGLGSCSARCLSNCWRSARSWRPANQGPGLTKGAVKLHLLLDHDGYLPSFAVITEGKKH